MQYVHIKKLTLINYRNHIKFSEKFDKRVIIFGKNGIGKTNILEAISLLNPGKGIKEAKLQDINMIKADHTREYHYGSYNFAIASCINIYDNASFLSNKNTVEHQIGTTYQKNDDKRIIKIDGKIINNHSATFSILNIFSLTPQMDQILSENAASRRKFFDKIAVSFFPELLSYLQAYDRLIKERSKILKMSSIDLTWLNIIEEEISQNAIVIIELRNKTLEKLNEATDCNYTKFPKFFIQFNTELENDFGKYPIIQLEEKIRKIFFVNREKDTITNKTNFGTHRVDFNIFLVKNNIRQHINLCSTGEQKALLCAISIAAINYYISFYKKTPIIILDEITSHFDQDRLQQLLEYLNDFNTQYFISSTNNDIFKNFIQDIQYVKLSI